MTSLPLLVLAVFLMGQASSQLAFTDQAEEKSLGLASVDTLYSSIVGSSTVLKVILINLCQLTFNTIGWYLTSWFWSTARGGQVSWDPDFQGAVTNGLRSPTFAGINLAVAAGSVTFAYLAWSIIVSLVPASGLGRRSGQDGKWLWDEQAWNWQWKEVASREYQDSIVDSWLSSLVSSLTGGPQSQERTLPQVSFTDTEFLAVLDNTFTFAATTQQFVVNSMLSLGGISFMTFMSYLPETTAAGKRSLEEL